MLPRRLPELAIEEKTMLNFNDAHAGLDLIAHGQLIPMDSAEQLIRTRRLIERLLKQLQVCGREATESEDTYLRRAIAAYSVRSIEGAIGYAFRAGEVGSTPIFGEILSPDRSLTLCEELRAADSLTPT